MVRLTVLSLFLLPFALLTLCWCFGSITPRTLVLGLTVSCLIGMAAYLIWSGDGRSLPAGTVYVPARLINGTVVPGHSARP